jgi:hypothetical protein
MLAFVAAHAKALTGALMVLIIAVARKYLPDFATTEIQEAIRVVLELALTGAAVYAVPNKQRTTNETPGE